MSVGSAAHGEAFPTKGQPRYRNIRCTLRPDTPKPANETPADAAGLHDSRLLKRIMCSPGRQKVLNLCANTCSSSTEEGWK
jgi:hypothetical protein